MSDEYARGYTDGRNAGYEACRQEATAEIARFREALLSDEATEAGARALFAFQVSGSAMRYPEGHDETYWTERARPVLRAAVDVVAGEQFRQKGSARCLTSPARAATTAATSPIDQDQPGSVCKLRPGQSRGCPVCQSALIEASTRRLGPFLTCSNERCDQHGRTLATKEQS